MKARLTAAQWVTMALMLALVWGMTQWWKVRQLDASVAQSLTAFSQPGEILMISSETCIHCEVARRWLTTHAVPFDECVIERDAACAARYQALYAPGTPVLVVRERVLVGFSPEAIWAVLKLPQTPQPQGA